ncbi:RNA-directed DNA polymerase, eukaryota, reverse transcriptase zinc-binding domain protein [Tanacetum coccineum]
MVKDFRPISLIGSMYKIITKVLANRLSLVILELVSDVQSAFVSNRHILDGPFILNELLSWCKHKKSKALIFKIDFEKAFDSVRWDYLDVVLANFGFGLKWRSWIQGCLNSAIGSILVNGIYSCQCSLPLYYMSSFKVPKGVLSKMESIRRNFFNGVENAEKKMSLIGWNKILASKKNGGLGVCYFFAYNRALLFKWIWRFLANGASLWSRFISAIYGIRGALDNSSSYSRRSPWLDQKLVRVLVYTYIVTLIQILTECP